MSGSQTHKTHHASVPHLSHRYTLLSHRYTLLSHCYTLLSHFPPPGPLNRAEWIKFVSLFFNKEAEANALFDNITAEYERYKV